MKVSKKRQITIPQRLRKAAGILPGCQVAFSLEGEKVIIHKVGTAMDDRRKLLCAAGDRVRKSLKEPFKQMGSEEIMAFLRPDSSGHG